MGYKIPNYDIKIILNTESINKLPQDNNDKSYTKNCKNPEEPQGKLEQMWDAAASALLIESSYSKDSTTTHIYTKRKKNKKHLASNTGTICSSLCLTKSWQLEPTTWFHVLKLLSVA